MIEKIEKEIEKIGEKIEKLYNNTNGENTDEINYNEGIQEGLYIVLRMLLKESEGK